ncbi:hemolysin family protein [Scrofimicrobium sp. R131]|uniref:Hemolysin family protein n=1 Tax=Scrofimicrobium appendicitidis TaxID=3079930 RepID=A0AAU7V7Q2_9ACTO
MLVDVLLILLGIVLTFGTAVFVAAEFSFVALDQASVAQKAETGGARINLVLKGLRTLSTQLSGAQVGITLTTILLGYTTQVALADLLTEWMGGWGWAVAGLVAGLVAALLVNGFSMLFGELVPKNMALADPLKTASLVAPLQLGFTWLFKPVITMLNGSANFILHRFGIEPQEEISSARSAAELEALVRHSAELGTLDEGTADLLTKSITMEGLTAQDVMTDRGRMTTLTEESTAADVVEAARASGHSRFPIIGSTSDDVVGLVNLRRAIAVPYERRGEVPVMSSSLSIPPPLVPETMRLAPLLVQLRDEGMQMAVVVDEYGGTSGIVTLEDVVEEIVGEVSDEHDRRRLGIRTAGPGRYRVPGTLRPDELADQTGIDLPEDGHYETLAGLVISHLDRIPEVGDRVEVNGVTLEVRAMERRRIVTLLVEEKR